jgi:WD40 repeat protein
VALSPDAKKTALNEPYISPNPSSKIRLWEAVAGQELHALSNIPERSLAWGFTSDAKTFASGGKDGLRLFDVVTGKELLFLKHTRPQDEQTQQMALTFSPDGTILASSNQESICLWDVTKGVELRRWNYKHAPMMLVFSPDARLLASSGVFESYVEVRVWETATGKVVFTFRDEPGHKLAFSPSGQILATSGYGGRIAASGQFVPLARIHLWDMASGQEVRHIDGPQENIESLAFAPNGRTLATGGSDSTILIWDVASPLKVPKDKQPRP